MGGLPDSADTVIIGGGVIGLSIAYHLTKRGAEDVVLLERNQLTSGTSWHAAGIIGPLRASMNLTRLSVYATELLVSIEKETGQSTGYRRTGGLWLARTRDRMIELERTAAMGMLNGFDAYTLGPSEIAARLPLLRTGDLAGALWVEEDGQANPVDLCMAYAKGARAGGLRIFENTPVRTVDTEGSAVHAVVLECGAEIRCARVVNCAGAWARDLGAKSGVDIPLQAVEHMYIVTEPVPDLPQPFPILRDLDGRVYVKEDAGRLVLGGFEPNAKLFDCEAPGADAPFLELPEDWEQFEPFMTAGLERLPVLNETGIQLFMNGPESFTPDTKQLMGEAPDCRGYFVAAGFNSIGIVSSAGAGRVLADWICDGAPPIDVWDVDIARFEHDMAAPAFLQARVQEAVASQFEMHWPYKQARTGRNLRHTPFHETWQAQGAVFGAPAGWERPLWFAAGESETAGRYSYGDQPWWPAAERESLAAMTDAVLIDLTPFAKFDISGRDAARLLQWACANDVEVAPGRMVYTPLLNERGGIEADATVTRLGDESFRFVGGAPTRRKNLAWIARQAGRFDDVVIRDVTRDFAVLGLMGPKARDILGAVCGARTVAGPQPFATSRELEVDGVTLRASRVSFIGEFGWEITMPWARAAAVLARLRDAGHAMGARPMGLFAVDCCRMEKGFRHWGHDIGPEETPLEAGLGFTLAWDKPGGFLGRDALAEQRRRGVRRRLVQFAVDGAHPLLLHDEPVFRNGALAGRTTSGARGFRTGRSLCLATLPVEPGETIEDLGRDRFEVAVAGERFEIAPLAAPPYDAGGRRLRGLAEA